MEIYKEALKGHVDTIILSLLVKKDMYGYELSKAIVEKTKGAFEMKEATLYVALKRLEKKLFIEAYWSEDNVSGGGRRRYYKILDSGQEFYEERKKEWMLLKKMLECFLEEE